MLISRLKDGNAFSWFVALVFGVFIWRMLGQFVGGALDEGIYLEGGRRVAGGERPYQDIFVMAGPVSYWAQAFLTLSLGNELVWQRLSVAMSIVGIVFGMVSIGSRITEKWFSVLAAGVWLSLIWGVPNRFEVNHRWNSMAFLCVAVGLLLSRIGPVVQTAALAGILMALAIGSTASFVMPAAALAFGLAFWKRQCLFSYCAGLLGGLMTLFGILWWLGVSGAWWESLLWVEQNYIQANRYAYGYFPGNVSVRLLPYVIAGSATLPLAAVLCLGAYRKNKDWALILLAAVSVSLVLASYPKWDLHSLFFVSPLGWAISSTLLDQHFSLSRANLYRPFVLATFAYLSFYALSGNSGIVAVSSRLGQIEMPAGNAEAIFKLERAVSPGSKLFVYPYLPWIYAVLDARNPTRYSFLQPGMMTAEDEDRVLADLEKRPPDFVFWQELTDDRVRRIWPSSNPVRHRFTKLETWIKQHYQEGTLVEGANFRGNLWTGP
jgi:hypothetical protein